MLVFTQPDTENSFPSLGASTMHAIRLADPTWWRRAVGGGVLLLAVAAVSACASSGRKTAYSPQELKRELATQVPPDRLQDLLVPHQVGPALVEQARQYVDGASSDHSKANRLVRAITDANQFGIEWKSIATTTARETVLNGRGNCLSLSALFVGLARGLGLSAYYVDASDRINSLERANDLLVRTGHIVATVRTERGWAMVDFTGEISNYRMFNVIDDLEALAHFYNNRGYEWLATAKALKQEVPWEQARRDFSMATYVQRDFARAHNNLGVVYSHVGREQEARQAYLRAIEADNAFAEPRQNLGNLSLRQGEIDEALSWYGVAIKMQSKNPYLRYHYGLAQYQAGDIEGAIESFQRAIALKHDYLEPRNLLAQAYRQQGRLEEAERVRQDAESKRRETIS